MSSMCKKRIAKWYAYPVCLKNNFCVDKTRWKKSDKFLEFHNLHFVSCSKTTNEEGKLKSILYSCNLDNTCEHFYQFYPTLKIKLKTLLNDLVQSSFKIYIDNDGREIQCVQQLIELGNVGDSDHYSDLTICGLVNECAREKTFSSVSFETPKSPLSFVEPIDIIGLQMSKDEQQIYHVLCRNEKGKATCVRFELPDQNSTFHDLKINGNKIQYASQVSDFVRLQLPLKFE